MRRRDLGKMAIGALLMDWANRASAAPAGGLDAVAPELVPYLRDRPARDLSPDTLPQWRGAPPAHPFPAAPPPAPRIRTHVLEGGKGVSVRALVVDPKPGEAGKPAILYLHGGGYVMFGADRAPGLLQDLAKSLGCVVVAVDYRLAPEHPFPAALDDAAAAFRWLHRAAPSLGIDVNRIAICGESAGGGLAASLAISLRQSGLPGIACQALIYPMLDDRTGSVGRVPASVGQFVWTEHSNRFAWTSYLGVAAGSATVPAGAVPARVTDLAGLPPTFIGVGSLDLFAPECIAFAGRLVDAGVPTEVHVEPGAVHGFDLIAPQTHVARRFTARWRDALRRGLRAGEA